MNGISTASQDIHEVVTFAAISLDPEHFGNVPCRIRVDHENLNAHALANPAMQPSFAVHRAFKMPLQSRFQIKPSLADISDLAIAIYQAVDIAKLLIVPAFPTELSGFPTETFRREFWLSGSSCAHGRHPFTIAFMRLAAVVGIGRLPLRHLDTVAASTPIHSASLAFEQPM